MHLFDYKSYGTEKYQHSKENIESYRGYIEFTKDDITTFQEILVESGKDGRLKPNRYVKDFDRRRKSKKCNYCNHLLTRVYEDSGKVPGYERFDNLAFQCESCKWWKVVHQTRIETWPIMGFELLFREARIQSYSVDSLEVPITVLNDYIVKNPALLYSLPPSNLEKLVTSVFQDFYACKAVHCGKSHDGGIDLIMLDSDSPKMVQVKRRSNPNHIEPVSSIREFIGAMAIKNEKYGKFVTTAKDFSKSAKIGAKSAVMHGVISEFELINYEKLKSIIDATAVEAVEPWEVAIHRPFDYELKHVWRLN